MNKKCRACGKQGVDFKKNNRLKDGFDSICKECYRKNNRAYSAKWQQTPRGKAIHTWNGIVYRCKKDNSYKQVKVLMTREQFLAWAIPRYEAWLNTEGTASIDRIDTNGHYELTNIQMISMKENNSKKKRKMEITEARLAQAIVDKCTKYNLDLSLVIKKMKAR